MHDTLLGWGVSACTLTEEQRPLCVEGSVLSARRRVQEGFPFGVLRAEKNEDPCVFLRFGWMIHRYQLRDVSSVVGVL